MKKLMAIVISFVLYSCTNSSPSFEVTVIEEVKEVISVENLNGDPIYNTTNVFGDTIKCLIPENVSQGKKPPYRVFVHKSHGDKYGHAYRVKV